MQTPAEQSDLGLADFARIIWHRKFSILLLGIIAAGAAFGLDHRKIPLYHGSAQLLLTPTAQIVTSPNGVSTPASLSATDVATAAKVISSTSTQKAVATLLKVASVPGASVSEVGTTNVVSITVTSPSAPFAARVANAYATAYISGQQQAAVSGLEAAATQISSKITDLGTQISSIQGQIDALTKTSTSSGTSSRTGTPATTAPTSNPQVISLQNQQTALIDQQSVLRQQVASLQSNANLSGGGGQVVSAAQADYTIVSPHKSRDIALAGVVGLIIGIGIALLREFLDDRIRSEPDLEVAFGSIPPLGLIPVVPEWSGRRARSAPELVASTAPKSPVAEAYRSLRTSIQFLRLDKEIRTIVITSPAANDGKTTTVANLAMTMAQSGQRVIVLSCDLRKPEIHQTFNMANDVGFTSVILGEVGLQAALQHVPEQRNLQVLPAGPIPPNPSELLASRRCEKLLEALTTMADVVLIDTPPVLPVTDAAVLSSKADATVLVVAASSTTKRQGRRAVEILSRVNSVPIGVIVNRVPIGGDNFYYSYGYGYDYGSVPTRAHARGASASRPPIDMAAAQRAVLADDDFGLPLGAAEHGASGSERDLNGNGRRATLRPTGERDSDV